MRLILVPALLMILAILPACHSHPCANCSTMQENQQVYRHVVAFRFKDTTTPEQIDDIVAGFSDLQNQIDAIIAFEHGKNVSPEDLDQDFTHVFIVTFKDAAGLDIYLPHPAHMAFVEKLLPLLDKDGAFVIDYVAE